MSPRCAIGIGLLAIVMAGSTACTSLPPAVPPTPQPTATATPASEGRRAERAGPATAVAIAVDCDAYTAWVNDPGIKVALQNTDLWPEIVAAGDKVTGGGAVDTGRMKQIDDQIGRAAGGIRGAEAAGREQRLTQLASRAMGLAARLAEGLADGSLDQASAGDAVARVKEAVGDFETEVAVQQAQCGSPATPAAATPIM